MTNNFTIEDIFTTPKFIRELRIKELEKLWEFEDWISKHYRS